MANQHNSNIPAIGNQVVSDLDDMLENLEYHKDVFEVFVNSWDDTDATDIKPKIMGDADNDTLVQVEESSDEDTIRFDCGGTQVAAFTGSSLAFNSVNCWYEKGTHSSAVTITCSDLSPASIYCLSWRLSLSASDLIRVRFNGITSGYIGAYNSHINTSGSTSITKQTVAGNLSGLYLPASGAPVITHVGHILFTAIDGSGKVVASIRSAGDYGELVSGYPYAYFHKCSGFLDIGDDLSNLTLSCSGGSTFTGTTTLESYS